MVNTLIYIGLGIVIGFVLGNANARAKLIEFMRNLQARAQKDNEPKPQKRKRNVIKLDKK